MSTLEKTTPPSTRPSPFTSYKYINDTQRMRAENIELSFCSSWLKGEWNFYKYNSNPRTVQG